jgi:hypothetical protein
MVTKNGRIGFVERIDPDYYGAVSAFKFDPSIHPRGECVNTNRPDFISKTKRGINDRVLVSWTEGETLTYFFGDEVEVISSQVAT